jgi:hypothetical protein
MHQVNKIYFVCVCVCVCVFVCLFVCSFELVQQVSWSGAHNYNYKATQPIRNNTVSPLQGALHLHLSSVLQCVVHPPLSCYWCAFTYLLTLVFEL